jgi:hypothetical protein
MYGKKIDGASSAEFAKAIVKNIPEAREDLLAQISETYYQAKVFKRVLKKK